MTTAAHAGAAVSSYFHPCYIFFFYIYISIYLLLYPLLLKHTLLTIEMHLTTSKKGAWGLD